MEPNSKGMGQAGQLPPELLSMIESLIELASREGYMCVGFLGDWDAARNPATFSNISERGTEFARVFHSIGDLIDRHTLMECVVSVPAARIN